MEGRFVVVPYGADAEAHPEQFDADSFVSQAVPYLSKRRVDAVVSSSDYPGCLLAAVIAQQLGLPGADPEAVLRSSHKFYARESMALSIPDATPRFALIRPEDSDLSALTLKFPFFVKPVKSWFSQYARVVESVEELKAFIESPGLHWQLTKFVRPFNQLLKHYGSFHHDGSSLIAEELLVGEQVTLEGYIVNGSVGVTGIVKSVMYPGTSSFERFVYPSGVSLEIADSMHRIAERVVLGLGLNYCMFNIEFIFDANADSINVVEVNPRMCGQFADLMQAVNGVNTYEVLCDVALGRMPTSRPASTHFAVAGSFPRRRFTDGVAVSMPGPRRLNQFCTDPTIGIVCVYYTAGQRLSSLRKHFDGASYRYLTVNVAGDKEQDLETAVADVERRLGIKIIDD